MKVPSPLLCRLVTHSDLGCRVQDVWLGCHKQRTWSMVPPSPPDLERMTDPRPQIALWPTPRGSFSLADSRAIRVRERRIDLQNPIVTDQWQLTGIGSDG